MLLALGDSADLDAALRSLVEHAATVGALNRTFPDAGQRHDVILRH
jgi:hypothetical protein